MTVLEIRSTLGLSQTNFSKLVGVSKARLYRHENNINFLDSSIIEYIRIKSKEYAIEEIKKYSEFIERIGE